MVWFRDISRSWYVPLEALQRFAKGSKGYKDLLITSGGQRLHQKLSKVLTDLHFRFQLHVSSRSAPAPQAGPISRYLLPAGCAATAQDTTQCSGSLALTWNAGFLKIHIFYGFKDLQGLVHAVELSWNLQIMNLIMLIFKRNVVRSRPIAPARLLRYCAFLFNLLQQIRIIRTCWNSDVTSGTMSLPAIV